MRNAASPVLAFFLLLTGLSVQAQPALFKNADLQLGSKLIADNKCVACHVSKVGGDGSAIYKPQGRINTAAFLRGMVEQCNTELTLGMFPEEVDAVAAVLNRDHYKFK
jgi:cytochrome c peroxidase